jgi:hypothetical protein
MARSLTPFLGHMPMARGGEDMEPFDAARQRALPNGEERLTYCS